MTRRTPSSDACNVSLLRASRTCAVKTIASRPHRQCPEMHVPARISATWTTLIFLSPSAMQLSFDLHQATDITGRRHNRLSVSRIASILASAIRFDTSGYLIQNRSAEPATGRPAAPSPAFPEPRHRRQQPARLPVEYPIHETLNRHRDTSPLHPAFVSTIVEPRHLNEKTRQFPGFFRQFRMPHVAASGSSLKQVPDKCRRTMAAHEPDGVTT